MGNPYFARMEQYKSRIPEQYHSAFDELTGSGQSPKAIGAAVEYIETPGKTQRECYEKWDVSEPALLNQLDNLAELTNYDR